MYKYMKNKRSRQMCCGLCNTMLDNKEKIEEQGIDLVALNIELAEKNNKKIAETDIAKAKIIAAATLKEANIKNPPIAPSAQSALVNGVQFSENE